MLSCSIHCYLLVSSRVPTVSKPYFQDDRYDCGSDFQHHHWNQILRAFFNFSTNEISIDPIDATSIWTIKKRFFDKVILFWKSSLFFRPGMLRYSHTSRNPPEIRFLSLASVTPSNVCATIFWMDTCTEFDSIRDFEYVNCSFTEDSCSQLKVYYSLK